MDGTELIRIFVPNCFSFQLWCPMSSETVRLTETFKRGSVRLWTARPSCHCRGETYGKNSYQSDCVPIDAPMLLGVVEIEQNAGPRRTPKTFQDLSLWNTLQHYICTLSHFLCQWFPASIDCGGKKNSVVPNAVAGCLLYIKRLRMDRRRVTFDRTESQYHQLINRCQRMSKAQ